jgi:hypothetical protein
MQCAKTKACGDMFIYDKIKPILLQHRVELEADLRRVGVGVQPPPWKVMESLLDIITS